MLVLQVFRRLIVPIASLLIVASCSSSNSATYPRQQQCAEVSTADHINEYLSIIRPNHEIQELDLHIFVGVSTNKVYGEESEPEIKYYKILIGCILEYSQIRYKFVNRQIESNFDIFMSPIVINSKTPVSAEIGKFGKLLPSSNFGDVGVPAKFCFEFGCYFGKKELFFHWENGPLKKWEDDPAKRSDPDYTRGRRVCRSNLYGTEGSSKYGGWVSIDYDAGKSFNIEGTESMAFSICLIGTLFKLTDRELGIFNDYFFEYSVSYEYY